MVLRATVAKGTAMFWLHDRADGLCWRLEAVMGDGCWCRHLVAMRGVADRTRGAARERLRIADRESVFEAIFLIRCRGCVLRCGCDVAMAKCRGECIEVSVTRPNAE